MSDFAHDPVVVYVLRGFLAVVLLRAALHKLRDPATFRESFAAYAVLPDGVVGAVARLVPLAETGLAFALCTPWLGGAAALAAAALLGLYSSAIAVNLVRGRRDLDCGCAGPAARTPIGPGLLLRNGVLIAMGVACTALPGARALSGLDVVSGLLALASLGLLYLSVEAQLALAPRLSALRGRA